MNVTPRILAVALSIAAGALPAAPVGAADFTFRIPMDVKNLDEAVIGVAVICELSAVIKGVRTVIGGDVVSIMSDAGTGNLPAQVEIRTGVRSGYDPRDVDRYKCYVQVGIAGSASGIDVNCARQTIAIPAPSGTDAASANVARELLISDTTKPCRAIVEGDIPRQ